jgi:hypothetical protein
MAIAPGQISADAAETPDGERVIVPTSIYAPGTLVNASPDGDGAPAGAPPHPGQAPGPGAGPAAGYAAPPGFSPPPAPSGMPGPGPGTGEHAQAAQPGEHPYGDYAYVIREEEPPAPRPRTTGPGVRSPAGQPPPHEAPSPEPASAWGPGDPAYGPPSPEWYAGEDQAEQQAAEELQPVRGVFEPLPNQGESGRGPAAGLPIGFELPEADGTPPLEQIEKLYLTAEAISAENLDTRFDELLERQRQLISAYFTETALQEDPR